MTDLLLHFSANVPGDLLILKWIFQLECIKFASNSHIFGHEVTVSNKVLAVCTVVQLCEYSSVYRKNSVKVSLQLYCLHVNTSWHMADSYPKLYELRFSVYH